MDNNKVVRKPVGCLFPFCECVTGRLGCAYEPYDMREVHNENWSKRTQEEFFDNYDEVKGG